MFREARNSGLFAVLDARTGKLQKQGRQYRSSKYIQLAGRRRREVYFASQSGDVTVVRVEPTWRVVCRARFGEQILATPAIVDGRIYLRTTGHLYCFGK
jgi:hypothetical protein